MFQVSSDEMRSSAIPMAISRSGTRRAILIAACILVSLVIAGGVWAAMQYRAPTRTAIRLDISPKTPPLPAPLKEGFLPFDVAKAQFVNSGIAVSQAPVEAARPFLFKYALADAVSQHSAVDCLTAAIYYEAATESARGQRAVAQVVLNRVRHPAFPKSVCGVVYQGAERQTGCQFSFTCDGSLARKPSQSGWAHARMIALGALAGVVEPSIGTATHYHADYVVPYWAWSLDKITAVGTHIFYRWKGYWGRRAAFTGVYAGEPEQGAVGGSMPNVAIDMSVFGPQPNLLPSGPRPLADNLGRLEAAPGARAKLTLPPRADLDRGTLVADENAGALIGSGPKLD